MATRMGRTEVIVPAEQSPESVCLPIDPVQRETPDQHRERMAAKRERAQYFAGLSKAAAAPVTKSSAQDTQMKAVAEYRTGTALRTTATKFGVGPNVLRRWLRDAGVPLRSVDAATPGPSPKTQQRTPTPQERARLAAVTAYVDGDSVEEIAARQHVTTSTVYRWLRAAEVHMRPPGPTSPTLDASALAARYEDGATIDELAAQTGAARATVRRTLVEQGVTIRRGGTPAAAPDPAPSRPAAAPSTPAPLSAPAPAEPDTAPTASPAVAPAAHYRQVTDTERATIAAEYEAGSTVPDLATRHGRSTETIRRALRKARVQMRDDRLTPAAPTPTSDPEPPDLVSPNLDPPPPAPDRPALTGIPDSDTALAAVRTTVQTVLDATDELSARWSELQVARDLDAAGAFGRIRVSAEQVLALANQPTPERTAS